MKILTIAVLFLATLTPVYARIGETMAECEKRYGKHIDEEKDGILVYRTYTLNKVTILIGFAKGKGKRHYEARSVGYSKDGFGSFEADMIRTFLNANKGKSTWKAVDYFELAMNSEGLERQSYIEKGSTQDVWIRADGRVYASSFKHEPLVMICTETYIEYLEKKQKANKSKF